MYKWFVLILFAIMACKGPSGVPNSVLGYDEMKAVLWDMAQVDEFTTVYVHGAPQKVKDDNLAMYQKVFSLHKISTNEFIKSYSFYRSHPIQEKVLMDSLSQFSVRQRQERYVPGQAPTRPNKLLQPAPLRMGNMPNDWHQYQFQTNFWYEQGSI